jgi:hypothetical protein
MMQQFIKREEPVVGLFKRKKEGERLVPCPSCSQLLPADALECDLCGADLREAPAAGGFKPSQTKV